MLFSGIHRVTPTYLQRITANRVTFNPITGLSLMATKASQTPHFQPKPTMLESLVRADLHCWRLRRATSSTNLMPICLHLPLLTVLLWYLPKGGFFTCPPQGYVGRARFALAKLSKEHITHESNADLSTSCIATSSPLVSTKYIVCNIVKADSFHRTNLMVKDIRYISYGCMFVATSLSSPTFTADCTWAFMLHLLRR